MIVSKQSQDGNLHVSGIFSAHHQEFSSVHSALLSFMQVSDDRFQEESGWKSTCFGHLLCPSSGVFYCTFGTGKFHAGFLMTVSKQSQDRNLHVLGIFSAQHQEFSTVQDGTAFNPDSAWKRSSETCMKLTSAECTVEYS